MTKLTDKQEKTNKTEQERTKKAKVAILEALKVSLGIVSAACEEAKISRTQYYEWLNSDPKFKAEVESMSDLALDFAESSLHKQIKDGVPVSTIFYLKTRGKKRGYIERTEVTGADGAPLIESEQDRISRIAALKAKLND